MSPDIAWYRLHGSGDRILYLLIQSCKLCLLILKCVLFNFIAMCPSDKQRPRLYAFGVANKREKKRRLDNAVTGTSKIQSCFETTTAGEDEPFEGNPANSNVDAVDVTPPVPAPEDEAAAQPPTAERARGPVDQALYMMLDNPTDRVFQLVFITVHAAQ